MSTEQDEAKMPHKPQFPSAPGQARKTATVEDSMAAAIELKDSGVEARRKAREHRAALARWGKGALPPEQW
ncbi:MAG: hypothetical protein ACLFTX_02035 [Thiohalospira sp.]